MSHKFSSNYYVPFLSLFYSYNLYNIMKNIQPTFYKCIYFILGMLYKLSSNYYKLISIAWCIIVNLTQEIITAKRIAVI